MRIWKFIKDEIASNKQQEKDEINEEQESAQDQQESENQDQQNNNSEKQSRDEQDTSERSENQTTSESQNSSSEPSEESKEQSESHSNEKQDMSDKESELSENQTTSKSQSNSLEPSEESKEQSESHSNEKQDTSDKESELSENQTTSESKSNSSEPSEESKEQSESQPNEKQDMSDKESERSENQTTSESRNNSSEPSEESKEQSESQPNEKQDMSDKESEPSDGQTTSESQNNSSEQSEESKEQSESQPNEKQDMSDKESEPSDDQNQSESKSNSSEPSEESKEESSDENKNDSKLTTKQKKELLEKLKKSIQEIRDRIKQKLQKENQDKTNDREENFELSEQTKNFFNKLGELPSFENRKTSDGYAIDSETVSEVPESAIRTLITKFLNQRFCKKNTDLNVRTNSLEKTNGFYKWEVKDVIIHLQTYQVTKVLTDKYGYEYANKKGENVPLSFYFDMSGSMSSYTNMLAVIAIELLKKDVKVLIGFNEKVNVQIESIDKNITISELTQFLSSAGYISEDQIKKNFKIKCKYVDNNIDKYLIEKKAEKCVIFADFDPRIEVVNLSHFTRVYWFCFESRYNVADISDYTGFIYPVKNIIDLEQGLLKVNEKRFEALCYMDNPEGLQKKVRVKK